MYKTSKICFLHKHTHKRKKHRRNVRKLNVRLRSFYYFRLSNSFFRRTPTYQEQLSFERITVSFLLCSRVPASSRFVKVTTRLTVDYIRYQMMGKDIGHFTNTNTVIKLVITNLLLLLSKNTEFHNIFLMNLYFYEKIKTLDYEYLYVLCTKCTKVIS